MASRRSLQPKAMKLQDARFRHLAGPSVGTYRLRPEGDLLRCYYSREEDVISFLHQFLVNICCAFHTSCMWLKWRSEVAIPLEKLLLTRHTSHQPATSDFSGAPQRQSPLPVPHSELAPEGQAILLHQAIHVIASISSFCLAEHRPQCLGGTTQPLTDTKSDKANSIGGQERRGTMMSSMWTFKRPVMMAQHDHATTGRRLHGEERRW